MDNDHRQAEIEQRLRDEADRLLRLHGCRRVAAASELAAKRDRRASRRLAVQGVALAVGVMVAVGVAMVGGWMPARGPTVTRPPVGGPSVVPRERPAQREETEVAIRPASPDGGGPVALPVFITVAEGDTERVIATGLYVPERTQRVDLSDLAPAERRAVREVLGFPEEQPFSESL